MKQELEIQQEIMLEQEADISSCLFVMNAEIRVIANNKVNIEKQLVDDCFL